MSEHNFEVESGKSIKLLTKNKVCTKDIVVSAYGGSGIPDGYIKPDGSMDINENGTFDVTEKAEVNVQVPSSAVYSGSFTPTENILMLTIDVGGAYSNFVLYTDETVKGYSVKGTFGVTIDRKLPLCCACVTNNTGTQVSTVVIVTNIVKEDNFERIPMNNSSIKLNVDNSIDFETGVPQGNCLGYFIAGVTYKWYAW